MVRRLLNLREQGLESHWRRSHTRTAISRLALDVRIGDHDLFHPAQVMNIGLGGAFLATQHSIASGKYFLLTLRVVTEGSPLHFSAPVRAAHVESEGFGVEFIGLTPRKLEELQIFLREMLRQERIQSAKELIAQQKRPTHPSEQRAPEKSSRRWSLPASTSLWITIGLLIAGVMTVRMNDTSSHVDRMAVRYLLPGDPAVESNDGLQTIRFRASEVAAVLLLIDADPWIELQNGRRYRVTFDMLQQIPALANHLNHLRRAAQPTDGAEL
ncbi:MAG TPA: PilZ domain-containing protein [Bdellovibrionota bacterium]|nr:PilZ domain-containing protein [Bdellovibrionota bacterium]